jgi:4-hydroxy-3-polyprenylbenzoate decarboxylase
MTYERKTIVGTFLSAHTMGGHEPVEFAIAIGTEPVTPWVAGTWSTPKVSKADLIGGIRSAPLELVKCETVNLVVPATSEIVIEGFSLPPYPIYHVTAISYRHHPILPVSFTGTSVDDSSVSFSLTKAANILDAVRGHGFSVKAVYCPPEAAPYCTAVSTKIPYPDYARSLANAIWKTDWGRSSGYLFIVEEDVDVTDMGEVLWAVSNTCHPRRGMLRVENERDHPLLPFLSPEEKAKHLGAYVLFDCTWPREWPKEAIPTKASFDNVWPKEVQEKILRDWHAYGYK